MSKNIRSECTWGDGPDILICSDNALVIEDSKIQVDLTLAEAKLFMFSLQESINQCESILRSIEEYESR